MSYIKVVTLMEFHGIFLLKKKEKNCFAKISISVLPWVVKKNQTQDNFSQNYLKSQNLKKTNWLRLFQEFMPADRF